MAQYLTYDGYGRKLPELIPDALDHFKMRVGKPPVALLAHQRNVTEATEIVKSLKLTLDVIENNGVVLDTIWLQEPHRERGGNGRA